MNSSIDVNGFRYFRCNCCWERFAEQDEMNGCSSIFRVSGCNHQFCEKCLEEYHEDVQKCDNRGQEKDICLVCRRQVNARFDVFEITQSDLSNFQVVPDEELVKRIYINPHGWLGLNCSYLFN